MAVAYIEPPASHTSPETYGKMFKFLIILVTLLVAISGEDGCTCWENYEAARSDGELKCCAKYGFFCRPCNEPKQPDCMCTQRSSTAVLRDNEGVWCSKSERGKLLDKWPCENTKEWMEYSLEYEKFLKRTYQEN